MKKVKLLLIALLSVVGFNQMSAEELTVNDGTSTNNYVPVYAYYADQYLKCEYIIPAADLASMSGSAITKLKYYSSSSASWTSTGTFQVFMKEVENTTVTEYIGSDAATTVYTGTVTISGGAMEITLSDPYSYEGGNLLIGFYETSTGNYSYNNIPFYGVNGSDNATIYGRGNSMPNVSSTMTTFVPKTTFTYELQADGPAFKVKDYNDGETIACGLVDPSSTKTITLKNPGTQSVVVNIATTGGFTADATSVTIEAKGEQNVVITTPETLGNNTGTITFTPQAEGLDAVTLNITATIKDPNKLFVDFHENALPEGWTTAGVGSYTTGSYASTYKWTFAEGFASYGYGTSGVAYLGSYYHSLVSPLMSFAEGGEQLIFSVKAVKQYSNYLSYLKVQYSADGGTTWTDVAGSEKDNSFFTADWQQIEVTIPATAKQIRFIGTSLAIDNIYGGQLSNDPVMQVVASDYAFGMIDTDETTTFTIKNTGKSPLTDITVTSDNTAFVITNVPTSIEAGAESTFSVTLSVTTPGMQTATITVAAPNQETATFAVKGYVMDNTLYTETFNANAVPDGWVNEGWTFADGEATGPYKYNPKNTLTSPAFEVAEGEKMAIEVAKTKTSAASLPIHVSKNGGEFTLHTTITNDNLEYNKYNVYFIEGLEAGSYKIRFIGDDAKINTINGFHLDANAPQMKVTPSADAAFGKVSENKTLTYTVENVGTGSMTVDITSDNPEFTVTPAQLTVTDEAKTFDITFNYDINTLGKKQATITVTPTYNTEAAVTINATAKAIDPALWDEDFEGQTMPLYWETSNWTVKTGSEYADNNTYMAYANSSKAVITTPRLYATEGQKLTWEAYFRYSDEAMKVEYSADDMATWTEIYNYKPQDDGVTTNYYKKDMEFTAPADGYYYLRFTSGWSNDAIDNFNGFVVAPKAHDVIISATNIPATGKQFKNYTATVTVKEKVNVAESLTAKFFIGDTQYGSDVVETVDALGTKQFSVTFMPETALTGEAYFTITNENINLETEHVTVTFDAAPVLDETVAIETMPTGTQDVIVFKYTPKTGWNTLCVPFQILDADIKAIFGDDCKYYEFKGVTDGALKFAIPTRTYAGYPLVVYSPNPNINADGYKLTSVNFSTTTPKYDGAEATGTFQGTFAPIEAPNMEGKYGVVPSTGRIQKGSATSSLKGWRGYFNLPEGSDAASYVMDFGDGTVITAIEAIEAGLLNANDAVYDMSGRKMTDIKNLPAGVYIQNGKKFVVK